MMKTRLLTTLAFAALLLPLALCGCAREVSHTESDKADWFGGRTRQETTVYKNADGTTSTESSRRTVR